MMKKKSVGRGRPPKSKAEKLAKQITVYLNQADVKQVKADSGKAGMTPSAYLVDLWRTYRTARKG